MIMKNAILFLCCLCPAIQGSVGVKEKASSSNKEQPKCGIYLAPSSIPGSGLGMYAGDITFKKGDVVTLGDLVIPISEYDWNNQGGPYQDDPWLWDEYTWNANVFPNGEEEGDDPDDTMFASPGVGAAANSYLSLVNIDYEDTSTERAVAPLSPGTGANTPYHNRAYTATKTISEGTELFVSYGSNYFKTRPHTYGYIPLPTTFKHTDQLLKKYLRLKDRALQRQKGNIQPTLWEDYYQTVQDFASIWVRSRVLNGLPDEEKDVRRILQKGGSGKKDLERSIKDIAWLEEEGQCMDNIKPGNSTIADAGRGAFANRFIPKGGLVAPAPLIHVENYNSMKIFSPIDDPKRDGRYIPNFHGEWNFQLLLNYCFGHEESTLVLCPYGLLTALINHSHKEPNTRIVWSKRMRHADWKEKAISEWTSEKHTGLQIDFVAIRDIEEDEEVLIDYGAAWEAAWQDHVANYVPLRPNYIAAFELNERVDIEYRTVNDVAYEVDGVSLMCYAWYIEQFGLESDDKECQILRKLSDNNFLVQLKEVVYDDDRRVTEILPGEILWNVPRNAFYFQDLTYARDHYLPNAFRHAMMIPDDMFPDIWKNAK